MKNKKLIMVLLSLISYSSAYAGGGYDVVTTTTATAEATMMTTATIPMPRYVCFDGRRLNCTPAGFAWKAKRGCYLSVHPCKTQQAGIYGYFPNPHKLMQALKRCQENYPFRLGEIQVI